MKNLLTSSLSPTDEGRFLIVTKDKNGDVDWIDAAEFAQLAGIKTERYPAWLNSMQEIGAVTASDRKTH
jgi:DNA-binding beta-propeller fold protein YncE